MEVGRAISLAAGPPGLVGTGKVGFAVLPLRLSQGIKQLSNRWVWICFGVQSHILGS